MDRTLAVILIFATCIAVVGAIRLNCSIMEHFDATTAGMPLSASISDTTTAAHSVFLDSTLPLTKGDLTVTDKLTIGTGASIKPVFKGLDMNTEDGSLFALRDGGRLGIGTVAPTAGLDITSRTGGSNLSIALNDALRNYRWSLRMREDAPADATGNPDGALMIASDLHTEPAGVMYLKRSGQVGLGTEAPQGKLHVYSSSNDAAATTGLLVSNENQHIFFRPSPGGATIESSGHLNVYAEGGNAGFFMTSRASDTGDDKKQTPAFGIGVPNPLESLHATGNARLEGGALLLGGGSGGSNAAFVNRSTTGTTLDDPLSLRLRTSNKDRLTVNADGSVIIAGDTQVGGKLGANTLRLGDLTITNEKGKLKLCNDGAPSSCRTY